MNRTSRGQHPRVWVGLCIACAAGLAPAGGFSQGVVSQLRELSFEELAGIRVTTVSKREEDYFNAAAAIRVITQEDIRRSGALLLPEVLRLAPGVEVGAINSRSYAVAIRGFNGSSSNKLLPLIDGRSLYSQRFASTIWDIRDLPLEDVEQIEVIGGPGGTAWGANAVNGVVNIITKSARDTVGDLWVAGAGNFEQAQLYARHGFSMGGNSWGRVYAKAFSRADSEPVNFADNNDAWSQVRAGFRFDRESDAGATTTFTGDAFYSDADQLVSGQPDVAHSSGGHLMARRQQSLAGDRKLMLQGYVDIIRRDSGGTISAADVFDLDLLLSDEGEANVTYSLGANYRLSRLEDSAYPLTGLTWEFLPSERWFHQGGLFFEATHRPASESYQVSAGAKAEYNDFTGWEFMPSVRASWSPGGRNVFWAAVSRAARIPSRVENDQLLTSSAGSFTSRSLPSPSLGSEILTAGELGWRWQGPRGLLVDASLFYHDYDDLATLQSVAVTSPPGSESFLENAGRGTAKGAEAKVVWQPMTSWQMQLAYSWLDLDLSVAPGSNDTSLVLVPGQSPRQQASLRSSWNVGEGWELDVWLRAVGALNRPNAIIPAYETADVRIARRFGDGWEIALVGQNLFESSHREFRFFTVQAAVPRGFYIRIERRR